MLKKQPNQVSLIFKSLPKKKEERIGREKKKRTLKEFFLYTRENYEHPFIHSFTHTHTHQWKAINNHSCLCCFVLFQFEMLIMNEVFKIIRLKLVFLLLLVSIS